MYCYGKGVEVNLEEAIKYYTMSADQGNDNAQNALGKVLRHHSSSSHVITHHHSTPNFSLFLKE